MNKIAIYTCIIAGYDVLQQPSSCSPLFDYICFVKKNTLTKHRDGVWFIRELDYVNDSDVILSRYPKINPHLVLSEYEYSLWIDGNLSVNNEELYRLILNKVQSNILYSGVKHWSRNCVYDEALAIVYTGKDSFSNIVSTIRYLSRCTFPRHYGMAENNVILRKHNDPKVIAMDSMWWNLFTTLSKRDQMTFSYSLESAGIKWDFLLPYNSCARNHYTFSCQTHGNSVQVVTMFSKIYRKILGNIKKIILHCLEFVWIQR